MIPSRAIHHGRVYVVLAYEGDDRFLVQHAGEKPESMRRDALTFLRPVYRAGAVVDDVLEGFDRLEAAS